MKALRIHAFLVLILCCMHHVSAAQSYTIEYLKKNGVDASGNFQSVSVQNKTSKALIIQVFNESKIPQQGIPVTFSLSKKPEQAQNYVIHDTLVFTNQDGIAQTYFTSGNKTGSYKITAGVSIEESEKTLVFSITAQSKAWIGQLIIGLLGGLLLFLFGMSLMSSGLQKAAGDKMRSILSSITHNNFIGIGVGAAVTMIIQSSSATSAMIVSFVNSGLIRFRQSLSLLMGAAIGTTITAQLIAFKLTDYSLGIIALGGFLFMFAKSNGIKHWGEAIFGFGILFFGMDIMSDAMLPLRSYEPFITLLYTLENPLWGILFGALFTALIQSSSAFIGIMIILASQGLLTLDSSIALLLGANLGTPVTALLASIKTNIEAKRVAIALLVYKVFLVAVFIGLIPLVAHIVQWGTDPLIESSDVLPRQIANAHTLFNIVIALLVLPFLKQFEKLILVLMPSREAIQIEEQTTRYIDTDMLNQPAIALQLAKEETLRLSRKIHVSLEMILSPFLENNPAYLSKLETQREEAKNIRDAIQSYLIKIKLRGGSDIRMQELFAISHTLVELSHINDSLTKILHRRAEKWIQKHYEFTAEEKEAIIEFHANTVQLFNAAIHSFGEHNIKDIFRVKTKAVKQAQKALALEKEHFMRLLEKEQDTTKKTYLDIINMFKTIGTHSVNISKTIQLSEQEL